jgi:hypothetical protein
MLKHPEWRMLFVGEPVTEGASRWDGRVSAADAAYSDARQAAIAGARTRCRMMSLMLITPLKA